MKKYFLSFSILFILLTPIAAFADPLCSDGSLAPGGNICNCASALSIGGSTFTPGAVPGVSSNTFNGMQLGGVAGSLASCAANGGISAVKNLFSKVPSTTGATAGGTGTGGGGTATGGTGTGGTGGGKSGGTDAPSTGGGSTGQQVPVSDGTTQSNTEKTAKEEAKTTLREQCLDGAAYAVAKTVLQKLSDKTLNWINTGFGGNPLYVRNIDSYLTSIKDEKLASFLKTVPNSNPIFGNAIRSAITEQVTGKSDGRLNQTMNTPEGRAFESFQKDFTNGGWSAFLNPNNNPVGAYFNASDQLSQIVDTAQQNIKDELVQGNGFLSMKKCAEYAKPASALTSPAPTSYGGGGSGSCSVIYSGNYGSCCTTVGGAATNKTQCAAYSGGYQSGGAAPAPVAKPECIRYENVTPGSVIAQQAANITGSSARQLENADKINEVINSFFTQLMDRLFTSGLSSLTRSTGRASSTPEGVGLNTIVGSNGQTLATPSSCQSPIGYNATTGGYNDEFDISRPQQLKKVILTQKDYITRAQDSQYIMQELVPKLGALDYCMPGPNPSWNVNLNDNITRFIEGLQPVYRTVAGKKDILHHFLDPGQFLGNNDTSDTQVLAGYALERWSLFDKVDNGLERITDRRYSTSADMDQSKISYYFEDVATLLKKNYAEIYNLNTITSAFQSTSTGPGDSTYINGFVKEALKETSNLVGYNQGIRAYNADYNSSIQVSQETLIELESINREVQEIVSRAKAQYIIDQRVAGTPVKQSCIDNAYQLGPVGPGINHLENITAAPDPMIQKSTDSSIYFYSHL